MGGLARPSRKPRRTRAPSRITSTVSTGEPTYVMCKVGGRSLRACEFAAAQGHDVVNVTGGMLAWLEAGYDVHEARMPDQASPHIEFGWIDDQEGLVELVDELIEMPRYALDTEFHRERTYFPKLALIQIAWWPRARPRSRNWS